MTTLSVIIATWNSQATLRRTLDSLRAQGNSQFEVLLSDGASSDGTMSIAAEYADIISYSISEGDAGVYDAWNKAIPHARGEWLMFLGSDDWLDTADVLENLCRLLDSIPDIERPLSYAFGTTELREGGEAIEQLGTIPLTNDRLEVDEDAGFSHTGLLHHASLFGEFGLFDGAFRSAGDYEFLLRTGRDPRVRFHYLPMIVAQMGAGGMSTGAAGRLRHYREMVEARRKLGLSPTTPWLKSALFRARVLKNLLRFTGERPALAAANAYRRFSGKAPRQGLSG